MLLFPKPIKKPKRRKRVANKSKFKTRDNVFKYYKASHTPEQVRAYANHCRNQRLDSPTPAEDRFAEILNGLGVKFERERILFHTDNTRFLLIDFWILNHNVAFEVDGRVHDSQKNYDAGRDRFLASHGVPTYRFMNDEILKHSSLVMEKVASILGPGN
jgi:very-short-patch-repair endonuclease